MTPLEKFIGMDEIREELESLADETAEQASASLTVEERKELKARVVKRGRRLAARLRRQARRRQLLDNLEAIGLGILLAGCVAGLLISWALESPSGMTICAVLSGTDLAAILEMVRARRRQARDREATKKIDERSKAATAAIAEAKGQVHQPSPQEKAAEAALELYSLSSLRRSRALLSESERNQGRATLAIVLSAGGPALATWVVFGGLDAHYLLGALAVSGVPLTIAGMLMRHDGKIRTLHRELERELAVMERVRLAVEFARTDSDPAFNQRVRRVAVLRIMALEPRPAVDTSPEQQGQDPVDGILAAARELTPK